MCAFSRRRDSRTFGGQGRTRCACRGLATNGSGTDRPGRSQDPDGERRARRGRRQRPDLGRRLAYLLRYDTVYGRYHRQVGVQDGSLTIDGTRCRRSPKEDPAALPWSDLAVDLVLECTGALREREDLTKHFDAGARFVILSAPAKAETIGKIVPGVNGQANGSGVKLTDAELLGMPRILNGMSPLARGRRCGGHSPRDRRTARAGQRRGRSVARSAAPKWPLTCCGYFVS